MIIIRLIKTRRIRWAGCVVSRWEKKTNTELWLANLKGNRSLERPKHRRENNIKWTIKKQGINWIQMAQNKVQLESFVNTVMNIWTHKSKVFFQVRPHKIELVLVKHRKIYPNPLLYGSDVYVLICKISHVDLLQFSECV
jgi:hypothetical protein